MLLKYLTPLGVTLLEQRKVFGWLFISLDREPQQVSGGELNMTRLEELRNKKNTVGLTGEEHTEWEKLEAEVKPEPKKKK